MGLSWGHLIIHTLVPLVAVSGHRFGVAALRVARSRQDGRQFVEVHDGRGVAGLQPERLAVRRGRLLVFPVQVKNRAQVGVTSRLVRPQARGVSVPDLRVLEAVRLAQRGRCCHRQLVVGPRKFGSAELLLRRLRQPTLRRQEQS